MKLARNLRPLLKDDFNLPHQVQQDSDVKSHSTIRQEQLQSNCCKLKHRLSAIVNFLKVSPQYLTQIYA